MVLKRENHGRIGVKGKRGGEGGAIEEKVQNSRGHCRNLNTGNREERRLEQRGISSV